MAISTTVMDFRTKATFRALDDRPGDGFVPIKQETGLGQAMRWIGRVMQSVHPRIDHYPSSPTRPEQAGDAQAIVDHTHGKSVRVGIFSLLRHVSVETHNYTHQCGIVRNRI
ncbi:hypothetical protein [Dyella sp. A6]|uniref:hypothetical protein n=1 Tax=Dyella aluminiiresistens TaxID=3069105 RepID=UPI002E789955|nr:hypothetical protein [Dyella sp. A6]